MYNLVRHNQVQPLLHLLLPKNIGESQIFVPIYRKILRILCNLVEASTVHLKKILQLRQLGLVTFLLHVLSRRCHTPIITLELCQLVVYMIRRSSHLTLVIFNEFKENAGYKVVSDSLTWIGVNGNSYQKVIRKSIFIKYLKIKLNFIPFNNFL